ncbi:MAG: glycosyltransferase family 2 protein [Desulfuromonadales bacterium]|nr:glycosyltransferase family 2 protein [Desulfuromonadales bacterium]
MHISVVIPNYNGQRSIEQCLTALLNQSISHNEYEIIVVDDCSTDKSKEYLNTAIKLYHSLNVIFHNKNMGRCIARNNGIRAARGSIIILVDNDVIVDSTFIEKHNKYHEENYQTRLAVISNLSFAPECIENSNFGRYMDSCYIGNRSSYEKVKLDYTNLPPSYFGGGISSVHREELVAVGLFDENIHGYGAEDEQMGYLLSKAGVRIVFAEDARALHYDFVSLNRYKLKTIEIYQGGYRHLLEQNPKFFDKTMVRYLLPVNLECDSAKLLAIKLMLTIILNKITVHLLELFLRLVDNWSCLYCKSLYKILVAGWGFNSIRSKQTGVRLVTYGNNL